MKQYPIEYHKVRHRHGQFWMRTHGIASMITTDFCLYPGTAIGQCTGARDIESANFYFKKEIRILKVLLFLAVQVAEGGNVPHNIKTRRASGPGQQPGSSVSSRFIFHPGPTPKGRGSSRSWVQRTAGDKGPAGRPAYTPPPGQRRRRRWARKDARK